MYTLRISDEPMGKDNDPVAILGNLLKVLHKLKVLPIYRDFFLIDYVRYVEDRCPRPLYSRTNREGDRV